MAGRTANHSDDSGVWLARAGLQGRAGGQTRHKAADSRAAAGVRSGHAHRSPDACLGSPREGRPPPKAATIVTRRWAAPTLTNVAWAVAHGRPCAGGAAHPSPCTNGSRAQSTCSQVARAEWRGRCGAWRAAHPKPEAPAMLSVHGPAGVQPPDTRVLEFLPAGHGGVEWGALPQ